MPPKQGFCGAKDRNHVHLFDYVIRPPTIKGFMYSSVFSIVTFGLHSTSQIHRTASFPFFLPPHIEAHVRYNLALSPCTIQSGTIFLHDVICWRFLYNINLGATHTTILSIRGVMIPIYLVSSAMDSIRQHIVLFKPVPIPTSDLKSEFLCQLSIVAQNLQTPPDHLVRLGNLPHPRHHISSILS